MSQRPVEILLVEDSPADVRLTREALAEADVDSRLHVVGDGAEALAFVRREPPFENASRPDVILLDLNLPRVDGRQVLSVLKDDPLLRRIPVVVLTTSDNEDDVANSYALHANCYVTKPVGFDEYLRAVRSIHEFWLEVARLPGH